MGESKNEYVKRRTIELYDSLPQEEEERKKHTEVRDEVIQLNYTFFGYVASHTFINNPYVTYEDKLQSALMHFCECWWWYRWEGHYRTDLSFAVFYKPRIGEMIERELNEVKYSVRRTLCMEVGDQLGKHWAKVEYDDLKLVKLSADKLQSLQAIFGVMYPADIEDQEMFLAAEREETERFNNPSDKFDSLVDLLKYTMITEEKKLTDADILDMADMYQISYYSLQKLLPQAESQLYQELQDSLAITSDFV